MTFAPAYTGTARPGVIDFTTVPPAPTGWKFRISPYIINPGESLFSIGNKANGVSLNIRYLIEVIEQPNRVGFKFNDEIFVALESLSSQSVGGVPLPKIGYEFPLGVNFKIPVTDIQFSVGEGGPKTFIATLKFGIEERSGITSPRKDVRTIPDPQAHPWFETDVSGDLSIVQDNGGIYGMYTGPAVKYEDAGKVEIIQTPPLEIKMPALTSGEPIMSIPGRDIAEGRFTVTANYINLMSDVDWSAPGISPYDKPAMDWQGPKATAANGVWLAAIGTINEKEIELNGMQFQKQTVKCVGIGVSKFKYNFRVPWPNNTRDPFGRTFNEVFQEYGDPSGNTVAVNKFGAMYATKVIPCVKVSMILQYRRMGFMLYVPNKSTNQKVGDAIVYNERFNGQGVPSLWLDKDGKGIQNAKTSEMLFIPCTSSIEVNEAIYDVLDMIKDGLW